MLKHWLSRNEKVLGLYQRLVRPSAATMLPLALLAAGLVNAATGDGNKAAAILDGFVEATGGKTAYEKVSNRVVKATFELIGQNIQAPVTVYAAKPLMLYTVMEAEAFGKIERGTDGDTVWEKTLMTGAQIKRDEERAVILRSSAIDAPVIWRQQFAQAEYGGIVDLEGKSCHKIVLTPEHGKPETRYYDQESKLLVKIELTLSLPMGEVPVVTTLSDYRPVDGLLISHKAQTQVAGQMRTLTTESVEHNVELPPERFDFPAEVKALLKDGDD